MLGFSAISETAISALPDEFSSALVATGTLIGEFDLVTIDPFDEFMREPNTMFVYAVEVTVQPISGN